MIEKIFLHCVARNIENINFVNQDTYLDDIKNKNQIKYQNKIFRI